jgi:hypothetical protein
MATKTNPVFDYRTLRLLMGLIAFGLPIVASILSSIPLTSISASYYTEARNALVGLLFIVGALLFAYNGHLLRESIASKVASLAAIIVALFPTSCDLCKPDMLSKMHYGAAVTLFSILVYFCFGPFRKNTKGKGGKKGLRSILYLICGWIMVACMLSVGIAELTLPDDIIKEFRVTYWAEAIALCSFGFAWIVAGKPIRLIADKDDVLKYFRK